MRKTISEHIPNGFEERINYGMPSYIVPHQLYPDGYHCDPKLPLPFVSFACKKDLLRYIIWESMQIPKSWIGLLKNILSDALTNEHGEKLYSI